MNFAIEDSAEQSAFRDEVRAFLATAVPDNLEHSIDPVDMTYEQYQIRRGIGGHDDHGHTALGIGTAPNATDGGDPVHARHPQVDQHDLELLLLDQLQTCRSVLRLDHLGASDVEHVLHYAPIHRIILDEQRPHGSGGGSASGRNIAGVLST